jgi:anti-sigma factor RsiW
MNESITARMMRWMKGQAMKRIHGMITCREFEDFILRYLDGELAPREKAVFELHMKLCRECRNYLAAYRRAVELGQAALGVSGDSLPDEVPEDLVKAILAARRS